MQDQNLTSTERWRCFPMGPKLRAYLGIKESDYESRESAEDRDPLEEKAFGDYVRSYAKQAHPLDEDLLVDLLDELVTMDLPHAALGLADDHATLIPTEDFRAQLLLGVAAFLGGDEERAEASFRRAQAIIPDEPAPYVNLVQILFRQGRFDEAELWCTTGLDAEPNNLRLWDLMAAVYEESYGAAFADMVMALAERRVSWAGLSLAAELTANGDRHLKARLLEPLYHQGERDGQFLIEYTAALGVAGEMDKIPQVVWQAERLASQGIPWQLHVHCAQAHLAMHKREDALAALAKAKKDPKLPDEALAVIEDLETNDEPLH